MNNTIAFIATLVVSSIVAGVVVWKITKQPAPLLQSGEFGITDRKYDGYTWLYYIESKSCWVSEDQALKLIIA